MKIFDLFKSKPEPLKELQQIKGEIREYATSLQTLSKALKEQINQLQTLQGGTFIEQVEQVQASHALTQKELVKASASIADLTDKQSSGSPDLAQFKTTEMNLVALNLILEMEMKDSKSHIKEFNRFCAEKTNSTTQIIQLIEELPNFSKRLTVLNSKIDDFISEQRRSQ